MMISDLGGNGVGSGRGLKVTGETLGSHPNLQTKAGTDLLVYFNDLMVSSINSADTN